MQTIYNWSRYREVGLSGSRNRHAPQCEINKALTDQGQPVQKASGLQLRAQCHPAGTQERGRYTDRPGDADYSVLVL